MVLLTSFQQPKTIVGVVGWAMDDGRLALRTKKVDTPRQMHQTRAVGVPLPCGALRSV